MPTWIGYRFCKRLKEAQWQQKSCHFRDRKTRQQRRRTAAFAIGAVDYIIKTHSGPPIDAARVSEPAHRAIRQNRQTTEKSRERTKRSEAAN